MNRRSEFDPCGRKIDKESSIWAGARNQGNTGRKMRAGKLANGIPIFLPPFSCQFSERRNQTGRPFMSRTPSHRCQHQVCRLLVLASLAASFFSPASIAAEPAAVPVAAAPSAAPPPESAQDWPLFRGDSRSTGVARTSLPDQPALLWKYEVPKGSFEGTPVIVDGRGRTSAIWTGPCMPWN